MHRPRYDDWSLPKGKLEPGEHPLLGALREVREETGFAAVAGRGLGASAYRVLLDGREVPKTVRWWALRARRRRVRAVRRGRRAALAGAARRAARCSPRAATPRRCSCWSRPGSGRRRCCSCGTRTPATGAAGTGDDARRPLDDRGCRQAAALAGAAARLGGRRAVVSAPVVRCTTTVEPRPGSAGLAVSEEAVFGEAAGDPAAALARLRALARRRRLRGGVQPGLGRAGAGPRRWPTRPGWTWAR